ncbi:MAG: glycosyltransferase family 39 protein, partial [Candidatus Cloacimonetes bacterium]|nr:glycosyltransferase family 39 protein [Candidatus Cloacimonadota bacterium]
MTFYNIKSKLISLVVSEKKLVIVLLIFGGLLRACIVINAYIDKIWTNFEDDRARIEFSNKIIEKGVIFEILDYKSPEAIFAPWVPFIITGKTLLFGEDLFVLFILNAILGTLTCLIIFYIAKMYFQNSVAILSLFWSCVYVNYLRYTATAGNEIWLVFFFVLTGFFALKIMDGNAEAKNLIGLGLSLTLLSHTDERYLAYIFLFPLLTYFTPAHVKSKSKKMLIVLGVIFLLSLPWQIRNYIVYKDILLISVRTTNITKLFIDHAPDLVYKHDKDKNYLTAQQIDSISNGLLYTFPDG